MKKSSFALLFILFLQFASADIISINSGGSNDIIINSDAFIEGFFGCIPATCAKLGHNCGEWTDNCAKTIYCGTCPSGYTCSGGICTAVPSGGESPGGGGAEEGETLPAIIIVPTSISLTLSFNNQTHMSQRLTQQIYITNNGASSQTFSISQTGLDEIVILGSSLITVGAGQTQSLSVDFIAPFEEKDFSGHIQIGSTQIPVLVHVTSNPLWFDSNIVVLNKDYKISQGNLLKTRVELVPMGEKSRLDVTLNYVIKDTSGKVYLTKSETVLVEDRVNFDRNFETGLLPLGKYIIALDLVYPGGVAPSSAHFEIVRKSAGDIFGIILFFLVIGILLIIIFLILLLLKRKKREKE